MKMGEVFQVSLYDLVKPLVGQIVTVTLAGEELVKARIAHVAGSSATLKVVPDSTKE